MVEGGGESVEIEIDPAFSGALGKGYPSPNVEAGRREWDGDGGAGQLMSAFASYPPLPAPMHIAAAAAAAVGPAAGRVIWPV